MRRLDPILLILLVACGPVPGGSLRGNVEDPPADWSTALGGDKSLCEIESRAKDPHSIQLECFLYEDGLYVQSHRWALASWWPVESWAAIWIAEPDVRVRLGDEIFPMKAVQVVDPSLREAVLRLRGYEPVPEGIVLFRFEPHG